MPSRPSRDRSPRGSISSSLRTQLEDGIERAPFQPPREEIERAPWRYIGYKGYTKFLSSDDDFFLLRRFDSLNVRASLALQDEISELEEQLEALDVRYNEEAEKDYNNGTLRYDEEDRSVLIRTISNKLKKYNDFLIQQQALRKLPKAPLRNVKSVRSWHYNHDHRAIAREEQKYLKHTEDLVALAQKEKTPLRQMIDGSLLLRTLSIWKHKEKQAAVYDEKEITYYSDKRMDNFASAVIIAIGVLMLITPIWILQALTELKPKLAVITVFIFVFLLVLSLAMVAKPFEALGATAAYAAVLMVFLQIQSGDS